MVDYTKIVTDLYQKELGRAPDKPSLDAWVAQLSNEQITPTQLTTSIRSSDEYKNLAVQQYQDALNKLYMEELGRAPDPAGLQSWATGLRSGQYTQAQLPQLLSATPEGYVFDIYGELLGRKPDPGSSGWVEQLATNQMTQEQFRNAVLESNEYRAIADLRAKQALEAAEKKRREEEQMYYRDTYGSGQGSYVQQPDGSFVRPEVPVPASMAQPFQASPRETPPGLAWEAYAPRAQSSGLFGSMLSPQARMAPVGTPMESTLLNQNIFQPVMPQTAAQTAARPASPYEEQFPSPYRVFR